MIATLLTAVQLAVAQPPADGYAHPEYLVEPTAVLPPSALGNVRILDLRGEQKYADGHVLGAVAAPLGAWSRAINAGTADAKFWRKELSAVGVRPDAPVAVYSDDVRDAARGWWMLKLAGVPDVRIMNGGWDAYKLAGGKVVKEPVLASTEPANWTPAAPRLATKADVLAVTKAEPAKVQIVDARSAEEYSGKQVSAKKAGHVPNAVHLEWTEFFDAKSNRFKTPAELRSLLADRKLDLGKPAITYCQSGGRSAVAAFGLELMGVPEVRNYYRSWSEWGNDPDTPVAK